MALGMLCGLWGAHIPSVRARYEIDEATFVAKTERNDAYASSHRPLVEACRAAS